MRLLLALLLLSIFWIPLFGFRFGLIAREKDDAHLVTAFTYAVEWINAHQRLGRFEYVIEFIHDGDYFGAISKVCKLIEDEKIVALFGSSDIYLNAQLRKITDQIGIPFFTAVDDYTPTYPPGIQNREKRKSSEIEIFPRMHLFEALSDLIQHWRWKRVIIVYVNSERLSRLVPFLEKELYAGFRFHFVKVENEDFLKATRKIEELEECANLNKKDCSDFSRILVEMNPADFHNFFLAALQMGVIELKHWFLLTSMEITSIDSLFRHNHARFISVNPISPEFLKLNAEIFNYNNFETIIKKDWKKKNGKNRNLRLAESAFMFDSVFLAANSIFNISTVYPIKDDVHYARCRSITAAHVPFQYGKKLIEYIKNTSLKGLTGDLSRVNADNLHHGNFSFRINLLGYNGEISDIGFWESKTDVNVNMSRDSKAQLQQNVQVSDELKPHFRVTTIMERPYVMLKKNHFELDENNQFEGFCIDLLEELSKDLGFTYTIHVVRDNKYGNDVYGNGTWDGMIGEILSGEADMSVAPFTVNFRRSEVVDFTKPFLSLGISILFKIPENDTPDLFSFMNPLSLEIWIFILIAILGITGGMYLVSRLTPYEWNLNFSCCTAHQPHPGAEYSSPEDVHIQLATNFSFWNTAWYVLSTMLKVLTTNTHFKAQIQYIPLGGCDFGPRAVSTRWLGGTWWVFTLVIISAYTANLAAVLTVSKPYIPIKNIDDLANQSAISYGTIKGGSTMQFFQESKIPNHKKMWQYMKNRNVFVSSNREGVDRVTSENYAYLMESSSLEYETQQNCNLTQIGGVLGSKGYGIALKKKSDWTDRFSRQILLYQKRGIIEMKKQKWWRSKGASCSGVGSSLKQKSISLTLNNVSGLFLTLFTGLIASIIISAVEFCYHTYQVSRDENKSFKREAIQELRFALMLKDVKQHRTRCQNNNRSQNGGESN